MKCIHFPFCFLVSTVRRHRQQFSFTACLFVMHVGAHEFTLFKKFYSKLRNLDLEKLSAHFVNKEIIDFEDKEKIFNATTVPENNIDKSFLSPSKWCYYKLVCNAGHHMPVRRHCWKRSRSTNETRVVIPSRYYTHYKYQRLNSMLNVFRWL